MTQLSLLDRSWCDHAATVVLCKLKGKAFTADEVHPLISEPFHPNWFGVLMARMAKSGLVRKIGYRPATRPSANGRVVAVWEVA